MLTQKEQVDRDGELSGRRSISADCTENGENLEQSLFDMKEEGEIYVVFR